MTSAPPLPSVSVLVTSYQRPEHLEQCLDSLRKQHRKPDRIVVVRRDEDTATAAVLEGWQDGGGASILRVVPVRAPGVVAATNAGLPHCGNDVVAFLDDDSTAPPTWLERLLRHYDDPTVGAVGGRIENHLAGVRLYADRVPGPHAMCLDRWGRFHPGQMLAFDGVREVQHLAGGNMSVRRRALVECDPRLAGDGYRWEADTCWTIRAAGYRVVLDGAAWNSHWCAPRQGVPDRAAVAAGGQRTFNEAYVLAKHNRAVAAYAARVLARRALNVPVVRGVLRGLRIGYTEGRRVLAQALSRIPAPTQPGGTA